MEEKLLLITIKIRGEFACGMYYTHSHCTHYPMTNIT
jgi:hypothetical protein